VQFVEELKKNTVGRVLIWCVLETPFLTGEGRPSYSLLKVIITWLSCQYAAKEHGLSQQGGKGPEEAELSQSM